MKKKLKLAFKKDIISNMEAQSIVGGTLYVCSAPGQTCGGGCNTALPECNPDSHAGCQTTPDATMTCANRFCTCNQ